MIERVIFIPEADDDVAGAYDWYESREPGLGEGFLRSIEACVRGIQRLPRCIGPPSMSFGERQFAAFHLRFSMSRLSIALLSTLYFTAHKIHKSGASVSATEHTRLNIGPTADCLAPART